MITIEDIIDSTKELQHRLSPFFMQAAVATGAFYDEDEDLRVPSGAVEIIDDDTHIPVLIIPEVESDKITDWSVRLTDRMTGRCSIQYMRNLSHVLSLLADYADSLPVGKCETDFSDGLSVPTDKLEVASWN